MLKTLTIFLVVVFGLVNAGRGFRQSNPNLHRLTESKKQNAVGLDLCPWCIDEAVGDINVLLNVILDQGILGSCGDLCGALVNKTGSVFAGDLCQVVCDALGIDEFIHEIIRLDLDPIWYCEMAHLCPVNDKGDAKFTNFGVFPSTGPQGTTFVIDCSFKTLNGTGTSMLRVNIIDPKNETDGNDYLIEAKTAGTYTERIGMETLIIPHCDSSKGLCDDFPTGTYHVEAEFCNGECDSHHPHSQTYDVGKASFTVTKKQ